MTHWTRFRAPVLLLAMLLAASSALAQGYGRIISETEDEKEPAIRPYVLLNAGFGDPVDDAYSQAFTRPYYRFGGGFGMKFYDFGAEVVLRRGTQEETQTISDEFGNEYNRLFYISTTELQFRVLTRPHWGNFSFPAGFGIGLVTMTVDRGYPGVFDRFSGDGLYYGPFLGVEYPVNEFFSLGLETEYAISNTRFSGSPTWQNQHSQVLDYYRGTYPATADDFWDTVGQDSQDFTNGGLIVSLRATVFIPTFTGN